MCLLFLDGHFIFLTLDDLFSKWWFMKLGRRGNRGDRCINCKIFKEHCFCDEINKCHINTKISVIMHRRERFLTSNTVNLAKLSLDNVEVHIHGHEDQQIEVKNLISENYENVYLFPDEESIKLDEFIANCEKPVNIIVPDGSWRQARKIKRRLFGSLNLPSVKIDSQKSNYLLRTSPFEGALCTFEAIMYALKVCESERVFKDLSQNFDLFNNRFYNSRKSFFKN
ncbi:MAG: DTW domain-containing protein [Halobacteriovoraceae bacterium]|nr:DTW domain-containing protein [Halobacteriovoraceae bacterium]